MRIEHQPPHFPEDIIAAVSSRADGSMRDPSGNPESARAMSRWFKGLGIKPENAVGLFVKYGEDRSYTDIVELNDVPGQGILTPEGWIVGDALVTKSPNIALTLPTGDCNSPMFVDRRNGVIALVHAGWHSTVNDLLKKVVVYLQENHGTKPEELLVHFPPSIRRGSYVFDHLSDFGVTDHTGRPRWHSPAYATPREDGKFDIDLVAYNLDLLHEAGVLPEHIEVAQADTFEHDDYFSHHKRHYGPEGPHSMGRIATVIAMKP